MRPVLVLSVLLLLLMLAVMPVVDARQIDPGLDLPGHQWTAEPVRMRAVPTLWNDPGVPMDLEWEATPSGLVFDKEGRTFAFSHRNGMLLFRPDDARYTAWIGASAPGPAGGMMTVSPDGNTVAGVGGRSMLIASFGHEGWERCASAAPVGYDDVAGRAAFGGVPAAGLLVSDQTGVYHWSSDGAITRYVCYEDSFEWRTYVSLHAPPVFELSTGDLLALGRGGSGVAVLQRVDAQTGERTNVASLLSTEPLRLAAGMDGEHVAVVDAGALMIYTMPIPVEVPHEPAGVRAAPPAEPLARFQFVSESRPALWALGDGSFVAHDAASGMLLHVGPGPEGWQVVQSRHDVPWLSVSSNGQRFLFVDGSTSPPRLLSVLPAGMTQVAEGAPAELPPAWLVAGGPEGRVAAVDMGGQRLHMADIAKADDNAAPWIQVGDDRGDCTIRHDDEGGPGSIEVSAGDEGAVRELYVQPIDPSTSPYGPARNATAVEDGRVELPAGVSALRFTAVDDLGAVTHLECVYAAREAAALRFLPTLALVLLLSWVVRKGGRAL